MNFKNENILTINAGSSSIKMALYEMQEEPVLKISGKIENIGTGKSELIIKENDSNNTYKIDGHDYHSANRSLIGWLGKQEWFQNLKAIGHSIVHGMQHTEAAIINEDLLKQLQNIIDYDPDHLPAEIEIIKILQEKYPDLLQVACFDTSFHTTIPAVAKTFAIPKNILMKAFSGMVFMASLTVI